MALVNDGEFGVGGANPDVFLRFLFWLVDDGALVFDVDTGETSLIPLDRSLALDFLRKRIAESATGERELQGFISRLGYFPDC
jgi:hypothetical protein